MNEGSGGLKMLLFLTFYTALICNPNHSLVSAFSFFLTVAEKTGRSFVLYIDLSLYLTLQVDMTCKAAVVETTQSD